MFRRLIPILLILFLADDIYASAWTRKKNSFYGLLEIADDSSHSSTLFKNNSTSNYYRSLTYKLYFEYGLIDKLTLGGFVKNYNFYSQFLSNGIKLKKEIDNDFYGNIFLNHNIINKNHKLFSLQYSFYFPIHYSKISPSVNTLDTKYGIELTADFGMDGEIKNVRYFWDISGAYKLFTNINYDQITLANVFGIKVNESAAINFRYEYQFYVRDTLNNSKNTYNYYNGADSHELKLSFSYRFLDTLSTDISAYKKYSRQNSVGLSFGFVFEY